jgi:PAS domain S-box-containing protein
MTEIRLELAREIDELSAKLAADGWDRLRGVRLIQAVNAAMTEARRIEWREGVGRAEAMVQVLSAFVQESPAPDRLSVVLRSAAALTDLLRQGYLSDQVDRGILPVNPGEWTFLVLGEGFEPGDKLLSMLRGLGFGVDRVADPAALAAHQGLDRVVLLASASWLVERADALGVLAPKTATRDAASPVLVAVADSADFRTQTGARRAGARLLLDSPPDGARLVAELAGLAWQPNARYRVLLVDDDASVLELHAAMLRDAGFEVLASEDPVAARDFFDEFAPEVCLLDVEMPACRGTDLAAVFRRDKRFAHLPVIYLSAFADIEHQLDARHAGGEDYLVKPVDARLLVAAVTARARQFRIFETAYRQRRRAWHQLRNLRSALDAHAIVSVAAPDGSIVDVNRQFCEISGYSRDELIGHNHRIVKSGHHPAAVFEEMWRTISSGQVWQGEVQNRRKDGSHYWVQSTIVPILDEAGLPEQYISIRTEITEQKRVQAERERQGRLLDAIRQSLQRFIVSHDLVSTSELLLDAMLSLTGSAYGFIGEALYDPDGSIYLKTHALTNIAWDEASRRLYDEAQSRGLTFRNLDNLFGAALRTGEAVIANDPAHDPRRGGLPEGHPPLDSFIGVPIRYGEALVGMVSLANRPGGYDASLVEFLAPMTATYASLVEAARFRHFRQQVIDELQCARDAAEQACRSKSEFLAGWGQELRTPLNTMLGHAQILLLNERLDADAAEQAREIVRGGEQFARQIGNLLERVDAAEGATPRPASLIPLSVAATRDGMRRRILIAEDNPANQAVLRMQLDVLGFEADIAGDGTVALAKWKGGGHDLILADRNMPNMDGLALARAIRATERESGSYIPIIAITAVHHPEELAACREAGMDDALPKPIELDDLRRQLVRWLPRASPVATASEVPVATDGEVGTTLDTVYLARLVGGASPIQVRELVDLFTSTALGDLPACRHLLKNGNGHGLALAMHKLKSSARMVGALRFAELAENLEAAAKGDRLNSAATLLSELEPAIQDVEAAMLRIAALPVATFADTDGDRAAAIVALPRRVLVVDDDPVARRQIAMLLSSLGSVEVQLVAGGEAALAELARADNRYDLLVSDLNMPGMDGIQFLRRLTEIAYRGCLILCSGVDDRLLQTAAELTKAKNLNLRGTLKKPMTQEALVALLSDTCERDRVMAAATPRDVVAVTPEEIQDGIHSDEFTVHFQPKVDAGTLRVVGVEALARWQRDGRPVPPDAFIATAERHGLIAMLSEVLITKALIGGVLMAEAGYPLTVAVNMSANWLSDIRLPEFIMASIQATGIQTERLILEITETGVMADLATSLDVMTRLRLKGFKLSIDDFGTGYSSMEQLRRIPFGELKLDRSFVQGAAENPSTRAILASSIEMARKLKLSTVAEGVETQADLDLVRGLGCDLVQGWFVARAMPVDRLIEWLREYKP